MKYRHVVTLEDLVKIPQIAIEDVQVQFFLRFMDGPVNGVLILNSEEKWYEAMFSYEEDDYYRPRRYIIIDAGENYINFMKDERIKDLERVKHGYEDKQDFTTYTREDIEDAEVVGWTFLDNRKAW